MYKAAFELEGGLRDRNKRAAHGGQKKKKKKKRKPEAKKKTERSRKINENVLDLSVTF
jgi:hypothetical protein